MIRTQRSQLSSGREEGVKKWVYIVNNQTWDDCRGSSVTKTCCDVISLYKSKFLPQRVKALTGIVMNVVCISLKPHCFEIGQGSYLLWTLSILQIWIISHLEFSLLHRRVWRLIWDMAFFFFSGSTMSRAEFQGPWPLGSLAFSIWELGELPETSSITAASFSIF